MTKDAQHFLHFLILYNYIDDLKCEMLLVSGILTLIREPHRKIPSIIGCIIAETMLFQIQPKFSSYQNIVS